MKTVYKTWTSQERARAKQRQLEAETRVKWDFYHTGQGMKFTPIVTKDTLLDDSVAQVLLPHLTRWGIGFVELSEVSGIGIAEVLMGAKTLVRQGKALPIVNRCGNFAGIKVR